MPLAVVTGASAGIGAATAGSLARAGFDLLLGARRSDRLAEVARPLGARFETLDVTDRASVEAFARAAGPRVEVLVHNAGGALGLDRLEHDDEGRYRAMFELNVMSIATVVRAFLPAIRAAQGHVVVVTSVAAFETYPGGAGYTAAKHGARAMVRTLRQELLGEPVRVTEIAPGLVDTEFSRVRFAGDEARARAVYRGMTPLVAEDVAECIAFAVTRPPHVDIDEMVIRPRDQVSATVVHRRAE